MAFDQGVVIPGLIRKHPVLVCILYHLDVGLHQARGLSAMCVGNRSKAVTLLKSAALPGSLYPDSINNQSYSSSWTSSQHHGDATGGARARPI